jgi:hypothetical protein
MPQLCKICRHPKRQAIEDALAVNATLREVAARFAVSKDAAARHWHNHVPTATAASECFESPVYQEYQANMRAREGAALIRQDAVPARDEIAESSAQTATGPRAVETDGRGTEPAQQLTVHQAVVELCRERGELATSTFCEILSGQFTDSEIVSALYAGVSEGRLLFRLGWTDSGIGRLYNVRR